MCFILTRILIKIQVHTICNVSKPSPAKQLLFETIHRQLTNFKMFHFTSLKYKPDACSALSMSAKVIRLEIESEYHKKIIHGFWLNLAANGNADFGMTPRFPVWCIVFTEVYVCLHLIGFHSNHLCSAAIFLWSRRHCTCQISKVRISLKNSTNAKNTSIVANSSIHTLIKFILFFIGYNTVHISQMK